MYCGATLVGMSQCCPDCTAQTPFVVAQRDKVLGLIEQAMRGINLRPGTADCDVNPIALNADQGAAMRHLEQAHERVMAMFAGLGATD